MSCPRWSGILGIPAERDRAPSPIKGEGWDEGDTPHLSPLPQGERMPMLKTVFTVSLEVHELVKHPHRANDSTLGVGGQPPAKPVAQNNRVVQ